MQAREGAKLHFIKQKEKKNGRINTSQKTGCAVSEWKSRGKRESREIKAQTTKHSGLDHTLKASHPCAAPKVPRVKA